MQSALRSISALVSSALILGVSSLASLTPAKASTLTEAGSGCGRPLFDGSFCDRRRAVAVLRQMNPPNMDVVRQQEARLAATYAERAGRQQKLMDVSSGVTVVGALSYLLMGGQAQVVAGYVALAPLVSGNLHANEPTRDLYDAGLSGLALISRRYEVLEGGKNALDRQGLPSITCEMRFQTPPATLADATKDALKAEDLQRYNVCRQMLDGYQQIRGMKANLEHPVRNLSSLYAQDLVSFDQSLLLQDRRLRYTPVKSLSLILTAPLRSLDTLLTGDDTEKALAFLNTVRSLSGLNASLNRVAIGKVPQPLSLPLNAEQAFEADLRTKSLSTWETLMTARNSHRDKVESYNRYVALSQEISDAATASQLEFQPDVVTGQVAARLVPPASASPVVKAPEN